MCGKGITQLILFGLKCDTRENQPLKAILGWQLKLPGPGEICRKCILDVRLQSRKGVRVSERDMSLRRYLLASSRLQGRKYPRIRKVYADSDARPQVCRLRIYRGCPFGSDIPGLKNKNQGFFSRKLFPAGYMIFSWPGLKMRFLLTVCLADAAVFFFGFFIKE